MAASAISRRAASIVARYLIFFSNSVDTGLTSGFESGERSRLGTTPSRL